MTYCVGVLLDDGSILASDSRTHAGVDPSLDRVTTRSTSLADGAKCVLVSFDATMRSNLSVGMPIDRVCYERDSLQVHKRRRFSQGDAYLNALSAEWSEGVRKLFRQLPELIWADPTRDPAT